MIFLLILCILIIMTLGFLLWNYQRQVKDICRQLQFLEEQDSNLLISRQINTGGIGALADQLNAFLVRWRKEKRIWMEKERRVSDTYTNLSHDIRTPLTSLNGYFQLLEESRDEAERERYLQIIQERIGSLQDMLEELFLFTRLENDSYQMELSRCCINRILKDTVISYYENWRQQGIEPVLSIPSEPLYIQGDVKALRRVFQNIIKNGLDHGEKQITISLGKTGEGEVCLEIRNRVSQSTDIDVDQVFERFYKADSARSKNSTGLGLSIARELILRMDGRVRAFVEGEEFGIKIVFSPCP